MELIVTTMIYLAPVETYVISRIPSVITLIPTKDKPPPCTLFYLANCKHGADCKYGHDYLLEAEHFNEIRLNAKRHHALLLIKVGFNDLVPWSIDRKTYGWIVGEVCVWGDDCCYGHYCSLSTKCHFFKQGRCKFVGGEHFDDKSQ